LQPGSEGTGSRLKERHIEKQKENGKRKKIKIILFGSPKKFSTFALPTERKGKKSSGGCRGRPETKRLKRAETGKRRSRLMPN
jgi:hypothetical protein